MGDLKPGRSPVPNTCLHEEVLSFRYVSPKRHYIVNRATSQKGQHTMPKNQIVLRQSAGRHTLTDPGGTSTSSKKRSGGARRNPVGILSLQGLSLSTVTELNCHRCCLR